MAIAIKNIPVLRGKVANLFNKMAESNLDKKHTIDFSVQKKNAKDILAKAKL